MKALAHPPAPEGVPFLNGIAVYSSPVSLGSLALPTLTLHGGHTWLKLCFLLGSDGTLDSGTVKTHLLPTASGVSSCKGLSLRTCGCAGANVTPSAALFSLPREAQRVTGHMKAHIVGFNVTLGPAWLLTSLEIDPT